MEKELDLLKKIEEQLDAAQLLFDALPSNFMEVEKDKIIMFAKKYKEMGNSIIEYKRDLLFRLVQIAKNVGFSRLDKVDQQGRTYTLLYETHWDEIQVYEDNSVSLRNFVEITSNESNLDYDYYSLCKAIWCKALNEIGYNVKNNCAQVYAVNNLVKELQEMINVKLE